MATSVFLAEDHPIVRQGLRAILAVERDFKLAGEASNGVDAVRLVDRLKPDVLVVDLMMPGGVPGLEVIKQVRERLREGR